jgi:ribosome-binding factor A
LISNVVYNSCKDFLIKDKTDSYVSDELDKYIQNAIKETLMTKYIKENKFIYDSYIQYGIKHKKETTNLFNNELKKETYKNVPKYIKKYFEKLEDDDEEISECLTNFNKFESGLKKELVKEIKNLVQVI